MILGVMRSEGLSLPQHETIRFITLLRGLAALVVVIFHLVYVWVPADHGAWLPATLVSKYAIFPPMLAGDLGVAVFFLVSGFIITHAAQSETRATFVVKRLFRIYPPHFVCCLVIVAIILARGHLPMKSTQLIPMHLHLTGLIASITLLNYLPFDVHPGVRFVPLNLVAWTLAVEMIFYTLTCAFLPLVQRRPHIAILAMTSVIALAADRFSLLFMRHSDFRIISSIAILLLGQVLYFLWRGRIRFREYVIFSVIIGAIFIFGRVTVDNSNITAFAVAYVLFIIALLANGKIRMGPLTRFFSDISYSLYLYHVPIGFMVLGLLYPRIGLTLAVTGAFAAAVILSYLSWQFVEKPGQRIARRLIAHRQSAKTSYTPAGEAFTAVPDGLRTQSDSD
jgi:peptidoglycan/LPS O-acetylase OafA/YrhL